MVKRMHRGKRRATHWETLRRVPNRVWFVNCVSQAGWSAPSLARWFLFSGSLSVDAGAKRLPSCDVNLTSKAGEEETRLAGFMHDH